MTHKRCNSTVLLISERRSNNDVVHHCGYLIHLLEVAGAMMAEVL